MNTSPIASLGKDLWNGSEKPKPESPAEAAQQFEALLVGQLLRDVRKSGGGGWLSSGEDQAADTMIEFAEEQIANALTKAGGLGLSRMIESSLAVKR